MNKLSSDLSCEETDLLQRSTKRIKETTDSMDFEKGSCEMANLEATEEPMIFEGASTDQNSNGKASVSYKDMLVSNPDEVQFSYMVNPAFLEENSDSEGEDEEGTIKITLSREEKKRIRIPWVHSVIVKAFGKNVGYKFLFPRVKAQWKPSSRMDCIDLGRDFFLFRFHSRDDYHKVMYGGPWFVGPYFLALRQWEPGFTPETATFTTTAVWARLPGLPIEFYDPDILRRIGNQLGVLLRIDATTASSTRGRYARICIQVDLDKPLVQNIKIGRFNQQVMYETVAGLCFSCGCIGHNTTKCPANMKETMERSQTLDKNEAGTSTIVQESSPDKSDAKYGPWMVVNRRRPRTATRTQTTDQGNNNNGQISNLKRPNPAKSTRPTGVRPSTNASTSSRVDPKSCEAQPNVVLESIPNVEAKSPKIKKPSDIYSFDADNFVRESFSPNQPDVLISAQNNKKSPCEKSSSQTTSSLQIYSTIETETDNHGPSTTANTQSQLQLPKKTSSSETSLGQLSKDSTSTTLESFPIPSKSIFKQSIAVSKTQISTTGGNEKPVRENSRERISGGLEPRYHRSRSPCRGAMDCRHNGEDRIQHEPTICEIEDNPDRNERDTRYRAVLQRARKSEEDPQSRDNAPLSTGGQPSSEERRNETG
ncbi:hypothetical protein REPUB_Repub13aG0158600 [Reevesia pubescens]